MLRLNILLDMDGVLCNCVKKVCETVGQKYEDVLKRWPPGNYRMADILGIQDSELWEKISSQGKQWWIEIEEFPWSKRLYSECQKIGETFIVTQPTHDPESLSGKLIWMKKFTGDQLFRNYMIGPQKQLCANDNNFLIDDSDANVAKFGKNAILFPMIHNSLHGVEECPADYALRKLEAKFRKAWALYASFPTGVRNSG